MQLIPASDRFMIGARDYDQSLGDELMAWNRAYQLRVLRYFAALRIEQSRAHPGAPFPGLFAEVDSITGQVRAPADQRVWSWGDCRGLGIWSYFLAKGILPETEETIADETVRLRAFFDEYCQWIHARLMERYHANGGRFPFLCDPSSNRASNDPRNVPCAAGELEPSHIFAAAGFLQHGIYRRDEETTTLGLRFLEECMACGMAFRNVDHLTKKRSPNHGQGFMMVTIGVCVDALNCMICLPEAERDGALQARLIEVGRTLTDCILNAYCDPVTGAFWEVNAPDGTPYVDEQGRRLCVPGHAAEACGFVGQLCDFLPAEDADGFDWTRDRILETLPKIIAYLDRVSYSARGLMFRDLDAASERGMADFTDEAGQAHCTAPWWNLREMSAASLKLFQLTGSAVCWNAFARAFDATYANYPNEKIGGLMVQTLDAETGEPLPFHPATGNLDPMHSPRARERETEALALLSAGAADALSD